MTMYTSIYWMNGWVNSIIFIPGYCYSWHYNKVWGINLTFPKLPKPYATVWNTQTPKHPDSALEKQVFQSLSQVPKRKAYVLKSLLYVYFSTITTETPPAIRELFFVFVSMLNESQFSSLCYFPFISFRHSLESPRESFQSIKTFVVFASIRRKIRQTGSHTFRVDQLL